MDERLQDTVCETISFLLHNIHVRRAFHMNQTTVKFRCKIYVNLCFMLHNDMIFALKKTKQEFSLILQEKFTTGRGEFESQLRLFKLHLNDDNGRTLLC